MSPGWSAIVYLVVLVSALASVRVRAGGRQPDGRRPVATALAVLVVGVPTTLQLTVAPWLLDDLRRDWTAIGSGQVWRLLTALVVQDGGVPGAVFNLTFLAVVGAAAELAWGARRWTLIAVSSGVGGELWGGVVQPVGAGNSVVVFGLAASLAVRALGRQEIVPRLLAMVSLLGSLGLLVSGDLHGGAAAIGATLAVILVAVDSAADRPARHPPPTPPPAG